MYLRGVQARAEASTDKGKVCGKSGDGSAGIWTMKEILEKYFSQIGLSVIHINSPSSANGVDLWVKREGGRPLSVEIKKARKDKCGTVKVDPVLNKRRNDDLIAIIINDKYVLIEPMSDHLKCCSRTGVRMLTLLCGKN
jgi:hypothetical protein